MGLGPGARVGQADLGLHPLSHVTLHDILYRLPHILEDTIGWTSTGTYATEFRRAAVRQQSRFSPLEWLSRDAGPSRGLGDLPATLVHGVFDDAPIVETELANAPNWLPLIPIIGERLQLDAGQLWQYERVLDLRTGNLRSVPLAETCRADGRYRL